MEIYYYSGHHLLSGTILIAKYIYRLFHNFGAATENALSTLDFSFDVRTVKRSCVELLMASLNPAELALILEKSCMNRFLF